MALSRRCRHRSSRKSCGCAWYGDLYVDGRRRFVNLGHDRAQAEARYLQLLADRAAGRLRELPAGSGFRDVAARWVAQVEREKSDRPQTVSTYRQCLVRLREFFGDLPVAAITQRNLSTLHDRLSDAGLAPPTVSLHLTVASLVLRFAVEEGHIGEVPRVLRHAAVPRQEAVVVTFTEAAAILDHLGGRYRDAAELVIWTGLRIGEVLALGPDDVDLERGILRVSRTARIRDGGEGPPKTRTSRRTVALPPAAAQILARRIPHQGRYFPGSYGTYQDRFAAAKRDAGVDVAGVGFHALRHVHAALLDAAGVSMRGAMARLGHSRLTQSLQYGWSAEAGAAPPLEAAWERLSGARPPGPPPEEPGGPGAAAPPP